MYIHMYICIYVHIYIYIYICVYIYIYTELTYTRHTNTQLSRILSGVPTRWRVRSSAHVWLCLMIALVLGWTSDHPSGIVGSG